MILAHAPEVTVQSRWDFLRSWCAPLRRRLSIDVVEEASVPTSRYVGLKLQVSERTRDLLPSEMRRIRNAVVLLSMVAHVDKSAWVHVLHAHCGLVERQYKELMGREEFLPRFVIELDEKLEQSDWGAHVLADFFADMSAPPSHYFAATAQKIARLGSIGIAREVDIPIVLRVWYGSIDEDKEEMDENLLVRGVWNCLMALRSEYGGWRFRISTCTSDKAETAAFQCAFALAPIEMQSDSPLQTHKMAQLAQQMITNPDGVDFCDFAVISTIWTPSEDDQEKAILLQTVGGLLEQVLVDTERTRRAAIQSIRYHNAYIESGFPRLMSAIAETRSIGRLIAPLDMDILDPEPRLLTWRLIAYALFSRHSHASFSEVVMSEVFISEDDIAAISAVLTSMDPTSLVFGQHGRDPGGHERGELTTTLKQGTPLTLKPIHEREMIRGSPDWILDTDLNGVKILHGDGESEDVDVLLPGYGVCSTRRDLLIPERDDKRAIQTAVTVLTLDFVSGTGGLAGLPRFIELVGAPLLRLRLQIKAPELRLSVENFLKWCPNLRTLVVEPVKTHTSSFLQAYRESNSQISELQCNFTNFEEIVQELRDQNSCLARNLKRVSYTFDDETDTDRRGYLTSMMGMLDENATLEFLDVSVALERYTTWSNCLLCHHNRPISVVGEAFPITCRLAFISVLNSTSGSESAKRAKPTFRQNTTSRSAEIVLDRHVLDTVFDYAAMCTHRRVYVRLR